ncbi:hypothetical protein T12_2481 [Trichinella patagoniensis]|uniref:C-type lectin domain-containing protein n=1 Tax=Trichinella patagoniensis TaxID=990121 RepID=A0A0V1A9F3_9BILA|nr:hypothetical protein T12_2481 [Trichinella patagoniensis]
MEMGKIMQSIPTLAEVWVDMYGTNFLEKFLFSRLRKRETLFNDGYDFDCAFVISHRNESNQSFIQWTNCQVPKSYICQKPSE